MSGLIYFTLDIYGSIQKQIFDCNCVFFILVIILILLVSHGGGIYTTFSAGEMPKRVKNKNSDKFIAIKSDKKVITTSDNNLAKKKKNDFIKKKELQKQLKNADIVANKSSKNEKSDDSKVLLRNISHKNSAGCSNWKKFMEMEGNKSLRVNNNNNNTQNIKIPLMKSGSFNENKDKSVFSASYKRPGQKAKITKIVAMDCEMVGIGENGSVSILARVSLVNSFGECIYDKYVKPTDTVTDYRTFVSGIRPHHLESGEDFFKVQQEVAGILKGKTLVGHALKHDLEVLLLRHPMKFVRDTSSFLKFRREAKGTLSLKNLANEFLNVKIQTGEHDSIEDARAAMQLYMTYRKEWEQERRNKWLQRKTEASKKTARPVAAIEMI